MVYLYIAIVAAAIILLAIILLVIDKVDISKRLKLIEDGMTGKEIQDKTQRKLRITIVNRDGSFEAIIKSRFKLYSYKLYFKNGRYERRERLGKGA